MKLSNNPIDTYLETLSVKDLYRLCHIIGLKIQKRLKALKNPKPPLEVSPEAHLTHPQRTSLGIRRCRMWKLKQSLRTQSLSKSSP